MRQGSPHSHFQYIPHQVILVAADSIHSNSVALLLLLGTFLGSSASNDELILEQRLLEVGEWTKAGAVP